MLRDKAWRQIDNSLTFLLKEGPILILRTDAATRKSPDSLDSYHRVFRARLVVT